MSVLPPDKEPRRPGLWTLHPSKDPRFVTVRDCFTFQRHSSQHFKVKVFFYVTTYQAHIGGNRIAEAAGDEILAC